MYQCALHIISASSVLAAAARPAAAAAAASALRLRTTRTGAPSAAAPAAATVSMRSRTVPRSRAHARVLDRIGSRSPRGASRPRSSGASYSLLSLSITVIAAMPRLHLSVPFSHICVTAGPPAVARQGEGRHAA